MIGMAFRGWPIEAVEFYEGLEADNSKVYWQEHKAVYERQVKAPMEELLAELADEFGEGKLFRPYRDVRFSAERRPTRPPARPPSAVGTLPSPPTACRWAAGSTCPNRRR